MKNMNYRMINKEWMEKNTNLGKTMQMSEEWQRKKELATSKLLSLQQEEQTLHVHFL